MAGNSFKVNNSLVLTPIDLSTLINPEAGDLACDINDNNKIKYYDAALSDWVDFGSGVVVQASTRFDIFNLDIHLQNTSTSLEGVVYHKATSNITIKKADIQIFDKNGIESGILSVDIKKGSTPSDSSMISIFDQLPSIDFSQAVDYESNNGVLNSNEIMLNEGDVLRIDVSNTLNKTVNFRLILTGER